MRSWNRVFALMVLAASSGPATADSLDEALARYASVESYRVTLRSSETPGGAFREVIRYVYRKPGWVRMDFHRPYAGMVLIYSPEKKAVRLWPFGPSGPGFTLSPDNWLLSSAGKHRVDRSDIGALLDHVLQLRQQGVTEILGEEPLNGRTVLHLRVVGRDHAEVDRVHRFDLWLDAAALMPLKVEARDRNGVTVDLVLMDDLELNLALPAEVFDRP